MTLVYQSTRDANNTVTASQAILQGLATDGGLFTPLTYPKVDLDFDTLKDASYQEVAKLVLSAFLLPVVCYLVYPVICSNRSIS